MRSVLKHEADKITNSLRTEEETRAPIAGVAKDSRAEPRSKWDNTSWQIVTHKKQNRHKGFSKKVAENGQNQIGKHNEVKDPQTEKAQLFNLENPFLPLERIRASEKKKHTEKGVTANQEKGEIPHKAVYRVSKVIPRSIIFTKEKLDQQFKYFNLTKYVNQDSTKLTSLEDKNDQEKNPSQISIIPKSPPTYIPPHRRNNSVKSIINPRAGLGLNASNLDER